MKYTKATEQITGGYFAGIRMKNLDYLQCPKQMEEYLIMRYTKEFSVYVVRELPGIHSAHQ